MYAKPMKGAAKKSARLRATLSGAAAAAVADDRGGRRRRGASHDPGRDFLDDRGRERLLEEFRDADRLGLRLGFLRPVAGHDDDRQPGVHLLDPARHFEPVLAGHPQVGEHHVEIGAGVLFERLPPAQGGVDPVPLVREHPFEALSHHLIVINHQNPLFHRTHPLFPLYGLLFHPSLFPLPWGIASGVPTARKTARMKLFIVIYQHVTTYMAAPDACRRRTCEYPADVYFLYTTGTGLV